MRISDLCKGCWRLGQRRRITAYREPLTHEPDSDLWDLSFLLSVEIDEQFLDDLTKHRCIHDIF